MVRLKEVVIHKYRCLANDLTLDVSDKITSIIGKNEIGKTSMLEAIAKANYFDSANTRFKYDKLFDYPRKDIHDDGISDEAAVTLTYEMSDEMIREIEEYLRRPLVDTEFSIKTDYSGKRTLTHADDLVNDYVYETFIMPSIPNFLFYDELSMLPSRVSVNRLINSDDLTDAERTAKALVMLSGLDLEELSGAKNFEIYKKKLEEAEGRISREFSKYWSGNQNLQLELELVQQEPAQETKKKKFFFFGGGDKDDELDNLYIDIRIHDRKNMISLPFEKRSKGFKWFFSFFVWFMAVQKEHAANFIFLLDEPGINLHEEAQDDLMNLMKDISEDAQIIFSTHSPYMIVDNDNANYALEDSPSGTVASLINPSKEYTEKANKEVSC
ncbi:MAG: AAA family ATPase [Pseudobutyrivibrio sp.]|nr:AAA family ATPase [Pseudobutyrivibrio sp.]